MPFDQWFSQDIGQGVGISDLSFNLRVFIQAFRHHPFYWLLPVYIPRQFRGILFPPGCPTFIGCRLVMITTVTGGIWFPIVILHGTPPGIKGSLVCILFCCGGLILFWLSFPLKKRRICLSQLGYWKSVVFGISFSITCPRTFPEADNVNFCHQQKSNPRDLSCQWILEKKM